jgi:triosephosphate isomerase
VGENLEERKSGQTSFILENQIKKALIKIPKRKIKEIIIAYEPVWAIGSKKAAKFDDVMTVTLLIRKFIKKIASQKTSQDIKILYGGSVNSQNAPGFIRNSLMDGLLIGGASLEPKEFVKIVRAV